MSQRFEELVIQALKDLKSDVKVLDSKVDVSQEIHVRNTSVLVDHERRSTASEKRIEMLEANQAELEAKAQKVQGFFVYGGAVVAALAGVVALFKDLFLSIVR